MKKVVVVICLVFSGLVLDSCGGGGEASGSGQQSSASKLFLNAFTDFKCTSGWTNRDGGLGRAPYSGSGSCSAEFAGARSRYDVTLQAQLEFDGSSPYRISLNGNVIKSGRFPYSGGKRQCDCAEPWRKHCPDKVIDIDAGIYEISTGDVIEFWGDDDYPCDEHVHGSYAKWRGMTFTPVK